MVQRWQVCLSATAFLGIASKASAQEVDETLRGFALDVGTAQVDPMSRGRSNPRAKVSGGLSLARDLADTADAWKEGGDARAIATTKAGLKLIVLALPGGPVVKVVADYGVEYTVDSLYRQYVIEPRAQRAYIAERDRHDREAKLRTEMRIDNRNAGIRSIPARLITGTQIRVVGGFVESDLNEVMARRTLEPNDCDPKYDGTCIAEDEAEEPDAPQASTSGWKWVGSDEGDDDTCYPFPPTYEGTAKAYMENIDYQDVACSGSTVRVDGNIAVGRKNCPAPLSFEYRFEWIKERLTVDIVVGNTSHGDVKYQEELIKCQIDESSQCTPEGQEAWNIIYGRANPACDEPRVE